MALIMLCGKGVSHRLRKGKQSFEENGMRSVPSVALGENWVLCSREKVISTLNQILIYAKGFHSPPTSGRRSQNEEASKCEETTSTTKGILIVDTSFKTEAYRLLSNRPVN